MKNELFITILLGIIAIILLFGPLIAIWSINTLFELSIAYSFKNWFAMVILMFFFGKIGINVNSERK